MARAHNRLACKTVTPPLDRHRFRVVLRPLHAFLRLEAASGILLLLAAVAGLVWANVSASSYQAVFVDAHSARAGDLGASFSLRALINDGLMTLFFFVVGMEVKRELVVGELNTLPKAGLPALAAIGGMVVPVVIFVAFNWGRPGLRGWGIPMATDIAFCVGLLALLKDRVPRALVVFVTALAIFDDIGGILVIALFYGHGLSAWWLGGAILPCIALAMMNRAQVGSGAAFAFVGTALWYMLHHGGIHATIAGVILGMSVPARSRRRSREVLDELGDYVGALRNKAPDDELEGAEIQMIQQQLEQMQAPLGRLVHLLHAPVAFVVMPLFALANAGIALGHFGLSDLASPIALGIAAGLVFGKLAGVFSFSLLAVRLRLAPMPVGASVAKLFGVSTLAGIGFTVALFIAALAFEDSEPLLNQAKLGILLGSLVAGVTGFLLLRWSPVAEGVPRVPGTSQGLNNET